MTDKIVICGANGYVGRNMVDHLARAGHKHIVAVSRSAPAVETWNCVERVTADLTNLASCVNAVSGAAYVYNFAANVGGIGFIKQNHADCMLGSVINTNLLRACTQVAPELRGYFFASSSCVYPCNSDHEEFSEDMAHPASPTRGYGWDKLFSEEVCDAFFRDYGVPVRVARYHTIYGPGDNRPAGREHVTEALCKKVVAAKLSGNHEITIWGDGEQTRSFLYVDDCIEGTLRIMHTPHYNGAVNLGNSQVVSVNQLVTYLEEIAGIKLARFYQLDGPVGARDKRTENSHARHVLNWEPWTSIQDGLRLLFNDYWSAAVCKSKTP